MIAPLFGSITRPLLSPLVSGLRDELFGAFTPRSLFNDGSIGVLYDNNDLTTMFLDAAGTTPATVNGLVGLQLDKSQGLVLGAEVMANSSFDSGGTGWTTNGAGWSYSGGQAIATSVADMVSLFQSGVVTIGKWYKATVDVASISSGSLFVSIGGNLVTIAAITMPGSYTYYVLATANSNANLITGGVTSCVVNSFSVKELPGNHRYQATTGSKPVLRGTPTGGNLVTNGDFASDTWWTKGADWVISGGVASRGTSATFSNLSRSALLTIGNVYRIELDIVAISGTVNILCGSGGGASIQAFTTTGRKVAYLPCSGDTAFYIQAGNAATTCTIDNVTIHDVSAGSVTAPYGLQYDGVDDFLQTASVNFSATDKMFVCAGVRKLSDVGNGALAELSSGADSNSGAFYLRAPSGGLANYQFLFRGTASSTLTLFGYTSPVTNVVSGISSISTDSAIARVDGVEVQSSASDQGTGNYGNFPLYFGRRGGTVLPFNGLDFGFVIVGKTLTAAQISSTERYIAQRTGVTL